MKKHVVLTTSNVQSCEGSISKESGRHILVYPKRITVELLISAIAFSVLEGNPPRDTSVIMGVVGIECIVKENPNDHCHSRR